MLMSSEEEKTLCTQCGDEHESAYLRYVKEGATRDSRGSPGSDVEKLEG